MYMARVCLGCAIRAIFSKLNIIQAEHIQYYDLYLYIVFTIIMCTCMQDIIIITYINYDTLPLRMILLKVVGSSALSTCVQ